MANSMFQVPVPHNEPVFDYEPGSPVRAELKSTLNDLAEKQIEIPLIIGGEEVRTGNVGQAVMPHDHGHVLATYHKAGEAEVQRAIETAREAWHDWSRLPWETRSAVLLKAADILTCRRRAEINAAAMLDLSKTAHQSEIDAVAEMADFWRYNPYYAMQIMEPQPRNVPSVWNMTEQRPLEGFVLALTPFNFVSIAGNLPTAPALMGNTVLWKPASSAVYSGYFVMRLLMDAGFPPGVINFVPGDGAAVGNPVLASPHLAGVHFTGSTGTFQHIWRTIGNNIQNYRSYPRVVGETGGKDFVIAHQSADVPALITALVRGAFEFRGQKCSAASRAYIPDTIWPEVRDGVLAELSSVQMGDVRNFRNFMGAVIDQGAFDNITSYIELARTSPDAEILSGGGYDDSEGYFIEPTVVLTTNPHQRLMEEEIFGPVLTVYVYPADEYKETLRLVDTTSPYGLTGAVFAQDRLAAQKAMNDLRHAAGNFYINDKPTGAVVGLQPFGGSRASGTNDKAGSALNLERWVTPRTIKENFCPPTEYGYPYMGDS
ncbi:MAG TPA: L-glutamate gamma-semialdehyde dehydrogenase [Anaerolineae bacterium]|nr:L-glutamate gamma-semialdehyde dehydrogenase [Anaerolineae bacterium]